MECQQRPDRRADARADHRPHRPLPHRPLV